MTRREETDDIEWLLSAIRHLPSDPPVPDGTPGYNRYNTQKDHWIGWLAVTPGAAYERKTPAGQGARYVYNR